MCAGLFVFLKGSDEWWKYCGWTLYIYKSYHTVHLKIVNFIICKLHLNKTNTIWYLHSKLRKAICSIILTTAYKVLGTWVPVSIVLMEGKDDDGNKGKTGRNWRDTLRDKINIASFQKFQWCTCTLATSLLLPHSETLVHYLVSFQFSQPKCKTGEASFFVFNITHALYLSLLYVHFHTTQNWK